MNCDRGVNAMLTTLASCTKCNLFDCHKAAHWHACFQHHVPALSTLSCKGCYAGCMQPRCKQLPKYAQRSVQVVPFAARAGHDMSSWRDLRRPPVKFCFNTGFQCMPETNLVHDNIVDSVLIVVFVVAQPHGEALWVVSLKVLHK